MFNPEKWPTAPIIEGVDKTKEKQEVKEKEISKEQTEEKKEDLFEPKIGEFSFEDKIRAEERLDNLGKIMKGADFDWNLDGGLNIPIYKGEYYRKHKDIEISVNQEDIEKLHSLVEERGYNLFNTASHENSKKLSQEDFKKMKEYERFILSDAEEYKGHTDKEIELHVHKRDKERNQIVDDVKIPKKYFENPSKYKTISGYEVNVSHPLVIAFHKLKMERSDPFEPLEKKLKDTRKSYDVEDLKRLRERLSDEDIKALEGLMAEEKEKRFKMIDAKIEEIFNSLDLKSSELEIRKALEENLRVERQRGDAKPKYERLAEEMASYVAENRDITLDDFNSKFKEIVNEMVNLEEYLNRSKKKLEIVKKEKELKERQELSKEIKNLLSEKEKNRYENFDEEKKEKERILEAVKEIYANAQEAKEKIKNKKITLDAAKSGIRKKAIANSMITKYLSVYVNEIVNIVFEAETEEEYIRVLAEKYRDEVKKKIEKKFSKKRRPEKEKKKVEKEEVGPEEKEEKKDKDVEEDEVEESDDKDKEK